MGSILSGLCMFLLGLMISQALFTHGDGGDGTIAIDSSIKKTIETASGDVIDCIDVYKQPAFSHPLLKHHKLQMHPSSYPHQLNKSEIPDDYIQSWDPIACPEGTVPIERTTSQNKYHPQDIGVPKYHVHTVISADEDKYYGAKATMNVWNPNVKGSQSYAQIVIISEDWTTTVVAGWTVYPDQYKDTKTRLFTYWTVDKYVKTGCFNTDCPGFVKTGNIPLNAVVNTVSTYGGKQYDLTFEVLKDKSTGNWWLTVQGKEMGYWPNELVPSLRGHAKAIQWGGEAYVDRSKEKQTFPEIGSGHFPEEGFGKAGYFKNVQFLDDSNTYRDLKNYNKILEDANCYGLEMGGEGLDWGTFFYYGGPGHRC